MLWLCIRLPALERAALTRLAVWAQQWSSWVSLGNEQDETVPAGTDAGAGEYGSGVASYAWLWLEIGASLRIFGGHAALRAAIITALDLLGHEAQTAIAPTPQAARLLTRVREPRSVLDMASLRTRLALLRLELLALPAVALTALRSAGFRRIGEVLDLPPAALAQRFGPEAARYLQRLCGGAPEPMPAVPFPRHYHARIQFDDDVQQAAPLLFPLQRLLWELQGWLRAADRAVQSCTLRFEHRGQPDTELVLRSSLPSREAAQWLGLARERFNHFVLPAAVRALHLCADEFTAPAIGQADFFAHDAQHAQLLHQVLDRLRARLGTQSAQQLRVMPDYRPERAWRSADPGSTDADSEPGVCGGFDRAIIGERIKTSTHSGLATPVIDSAAIDAAPRPCWLLREPRALHMPPRLVEGPERIESGWWDHGDVARDYYLARDVDGTRQWVYQDLRSGAWYLHGLWA
jgi:protein ImuB